MRPPRNPVLSLAEPRDDERRRHGRIRTEEITCPLGEVVDMSASGMKIQRKGRPTAEPGERLHLTLTYSELSLDVEARITRLSRVGFRRYVYGLEFEAASPQLQARLTAFARIAGDQVVFNRPASA